MKEVCNSVSMDKCGGLSGCIILGSVCEPLGTQCSFPKNINDCQNDLSMKKSCVWVVGSTELKEKTGKCVVNDWMKAACDLVEECTITEKCATFKTNAECMSDQANNVCIWTY